MDPQLQQQPEFLWRRMLDVPPAWSVWLPVAFAVFVVYLIALFRQEKKSVASLLLPVVVLLMGLIGWLGYQLQDALGFQVAWHVFIPACLALIVAYLAIMFALSRGMQTLLIPLVAIVVVGVVYAVAGLQIFLGLFSWWYLLGPTLLIALFYVGMMYWKDAQSVHPAVAGFLGLLRCLVYLILTIVFLLPGCQTFETTEYHAKSGILFDVSGSVVKTIDDLPEVGQDQTKLPTRQDKVIQFLTERKKDKPSFLEAALPKSPFTAYRFGSMLDESQIVTMSTDKMPTAEELEAWLKPDPKNYVPKDGLSPEDQEKRKQRYQDVCESLLAGTNIGGSALQFAKLEGANYLQYVVLVSDGQNNLGSEDSIREFVNRLTGGKRKVPVITIGVGEFRLPASIRIDDLQAPESARPDDKFPVRVPVVGSGLGDEEFTVVLEATRVKDALGQPVAGEKTYQFPAKKGKFQGGGDYPQDVVEYEVDVQALKGVEAAKDSEGVLEGTWQFVAKVPRHPREPFAKAEHVSDPPTEVLVQKRKLRVLLFAGGPTREYQFLRTLLYREVTEKRLDLSIYLQTGKEEQHVDQDVEPERFLRNFPNKIGPSEAGDKYMSLSDYDVVVAIDPDWLALDVSQYKLLRDWVDKDSGGVIFVGGPVHTFQLARPAGVDISALKTLLPVDLNDSRLHGLGGIGHDTTRPYVLNFTAAAKLFDFLNLEEGADATAGWNKFFWEGGVRSNEKDAKPKRGFFNYYPVNKIKPASQVIATFAGPESSRINDGKDEQPFMVEMRFGSGKSFYLGSAETWRLRHAKDSYHERFWIKLCRYMAAGTTQQKKYGRILMGRTAPVGNIVFEAQIKGKNFLPLPADERPTVYVKRLDAAGNGGPPKRDETFDLKAKPTQGEPSGWFVGNFAIKEPGEYEFRVPIPGTNESLTQRLTVRRPNPETDNVRNNFGLLYTIASDAKETLDTLPAESLTKVLPKFWTADGARAEPGKQKLFFRLEHADAIADLLKPLTPKREQVKGKLDDLWDQGAATGWTPSSYHLAWSLPLFVGLLGMAILLMFGQYLLAGLFMAVGVLFSLVPIVYDLIAKPNWPDVPVNFSFVLIVIVTLLGVEWLTRKLLKLA